MTNSLEGLLLQPSLLTIYFSWRDILKMEPGAIQPQDVGWSCREKRPGCPS